MPKATSRSKLDNVLAGLDRGDNYPKIARDTGVSHGTISNIRAEHRPNLKRSVGGRPRKVSPTTARHALRLITQSDRTSAVQVTRAINAITGERVHPETMRRAMKKIGWKASRGTEKSQLTERRKHDQDTCVGLRKRRTVKK